MSDTVKAIILPKVTESIDHTTEDAVADALRLLTSAGGEVVELEREVQVTAVPDELFVSDPIWRWVAAWEAVPNE